MKSKKKNLILNYLNMVEFKNSWIFKILFITFCFVFLVFFMKLLMSGKFNIYLFGIDFILGIIVAKYIKKYGGMKNES